MCMQVSNSSNVAMRCREGMQVCQKGACTQRMSDKPCRLHPWQTQRWYKSRERPHSPPAIAIAHMNMVAQSIEIFHFIGASTTVFLKVSVEIQSTQTRSLDLWLENTEQTSQINVLGCKLSDCSEWACNDVWDDEGFQCGGHVVRSLGPKRLRECITEFGIVPNTLHGCSISYGTEFLQPFLEQLHVADCWSDMVGMWAPLVFGYLVIGVLSTLSDWRALETDDGSDRKLKPKW